MTTPDWPFIGSEAIANGRVRKCELRSRYAPVFPDVYAPAAATLSLPHRAKAAWLWANREAVIGGLTAAGLYGAKWIDDACPVELVWSNARRPCGITTYDYRLRPEEITYRRGLPITTLARTAFDIGRRGSVDTAVARLDALGNATGLTVAEPLNIARVHRGARHLRKLEAALELYDPGAASPRETWLRLLVMRDGYPRPQTQIPVRSADGYRQYFLDMGWADRMLAMEYDGEQHRIDSVQYAYDVQRSEDIAELGWTRLRVVKENSSADVLRRLDRAWRSKLRTDREIS